MTVKVQIGILCAAGSNDQNELRQCLAQHISELKPSIFKNGDNFVQLISHDEAQTLIAAGIPRL